MVTNLLTRINYVDATHTYLGHTADYITMDLIYDSLIWTAGYASADPLLYVGDLMTHEPSASDLNRAATIISDIADTTITLCLLNDYSHDVGGSDIYTHKVIGMGENKQFVYCFSFDNITAMEPRLEAWDDNNHNSQLKNVLGANTPANSMVKAVCTTDSAPGDDWVGTAIAGVANYILLNAGNGALTVAKDLYSNIKIVIPTAYATPAVEVFILTVRYTYF